MRQQALMQVTYQAGGVLFMFESALPRGERALPLAISTRDPTSMFASRRRVHLHQPADFRMVVTLPASRPAASESNNMRSTNPAHGRSTGKMKVRTGIRLAARTIAGAQMSDAAASKTSCGACIAGRSRRPHHRTY